MPATRTPAAAVTLVKVQSRLLRSNSPAPPTPVPVV